MRNKSIEELANRIVSLDRTLVSDGYDQALKIISEYIPIKTHKIPSGKEIWTWVVPKKWTVKESYFSDGSNRYADYQKNPLHLISYSKPFKGKVSREELLKHIRTIKKYPDEIPFHYSYYDDEWGFCMAENELKKLKSDFYDVNIDVELTDGHLKIGEYFKKGESENCFVFMAHLCHPGQFNDGLSGVLASVSVAKRLEKISTYYSYRILIFPETVGSIAYLSQNEKLIPFMKGAIASEMLAVNQKISIQHSFDASSYIDQVVCKVLEDKSIEYREGDFLKVLRNDEKIFNSPGVMVPSVSITRSNFPGHKDFPIYGYHTSYDNINNASLDKLDEACLLMEEIIDYIESDYVPRRNFKGQVMLSRYNLFVKPSKDRKLYNKLEKLMWFLEGDKSIIEISRDLKINFKWLKGYLNSYKENNLVSYTRKF